MAIVLALSMTANVLPGSPLQRTFAVFTGAASQSGSITAGTWDTTLPAPSDLECRVGHHWWNYFDAELGWGAVPGAQKYLVYYSRPLSGYFRLLAKVNAPSTEYDELRRSLLYHRYYVTAANSSGESDPSEIIRVKCAPKRDFYDGPRDLKGKHRPHEGAPDHFGVLAATGTPSPLATGSGATRDIELTWGRDGRSKKYIVLRGETRDGPYLERSTTTEARFVDANVPAPVSYYYVVVGVDEDGAESEPTNEIAVAGVVVPVVPSPSPTATTTASPTVTAVSVKASPTIPPTQTATPTPTATPTRATTPTSGGTSGASGGSGSGTMTPVATASPTSTPSPTPAASAVPTATATPTPSATPSASPTAQATASPTPTASATAVPPTVSPTPTSPTPTATPKS